MARCGQPLLPPKPNDAGLRLQRATRGPDTDSVEGGGCRADTALFMIRINRQLLHDHRRWGVTIVDACYGLVADPVWPT